MRYLSLLFAGIVLVGCSSSKSVQNEAAVRQGVLDYLSQRSDLNLSSMQVDVTSVSFRQNEADATVAFRPKGTSGAAGMQLQYTLERKGSRWVVKGRGRSQAGASPHGAQMPGSMPPGGMHAPAAGSAPADAGAKQGGAALPPDHPPIGRGSGAK